MNVFWLRFVIAILLLAVLAVAAIPLFVLLDLASGNTGYGLCPTGVSSCAIGYAEGPELAVGLILLLFGLVAAIRVVMRIARRMDNLAEAAKLSGFTGQN